MPTVSELNTARDEAGAAYAAAAAAYVAAWKELSAYDMAIGSSHVGGPRNTQLRFTAVAEVAPHPVYLANVASLYPAKTVTDRDARIKQIIAGG